jgi:nucleotide-binding universal stress UspA family protein
MEPNFIWLMLFPVLPIHSRNLRPWNSHPKQRKRDLLQLEHDLVESATLDGIDHEFLLRQGVVWDELQSIISQNQTELVVLGTHGRRGLGRIVLGSVAEDVFRHANCLLLTIGPELLCV